VRFQVLTAASMMFRVVFWDILPCKMIFDRRFRGAYCLHHQGWWTSLNISQSWQYENVNVPLFLERFTLQQDLCLSALIFESLWLKVFRLRIWEAQVQISDWRSAILIEFSWFYWVTPGIYWDRSHIKFDHDRYFPHPFQFIINSHIFTAESNGSYWQRR
jgi:hypothetical protein